MDFVPKVRSAVGLLDGANHEFEHAGGEVTFHYDHATKDVLRG